MARATPQSVAVEEARASEVVRLARQEDPDVAERLIELVGHLPASSGTEFSPGGLDLQRQIAADGGPLHAATVLLSARALGKTLDERLLCAAAGLELLVCFPARLMEVTEDVSSAERRRENTRAILMADFAVASALHPLSKLPSAMVAAAADLACTMSEGAALELDGLRSGRRVADDPAIIDRRDAASVALAARFGAELAEAPPSVAKALELYGREVGTAYALASGIEPAVEKCAVHADRARSALNGLDGINRSALNALAGLAGEPARVRPRIAPAA